MELKTAIMERHSTRGFSDRPVSRETLRDVLTMAERAVSSVNCQPWEFAVVTGDVLRTLCAEITECFERGDPADITPWFGEGIYRSRRSEIGKQLFAAMDICREDREKRRWWTARGYRFFDAPAAILLMMDNSADEFSCRLDMGCVIQNICLASMEFGLGTCVEYQGVSYLEPLRRNLPASQGKRFVCAIAIGYPDESFPANRVVSSRADVDEITSWYGFDEE
ncbi:MAG: nitroreductase [Oscillospiraceae bacterium]|nr:nitroreductase [Oscillospiraceae bacterium]